MLGYFSSTQMGLIESLFETIGDPDPWGSIINPIWAAHLTDVKEARDHAAEFRAVPPQPEAPLKNLLVSPPLCSLPLEGRRCRRPCLSPLSYAMKDSPDRSGSSLQHRGHMRSGRIAEAPA